MTRQTTRMTTLLLLIVVGRFILPTATYADATTDDLLILVNRTHRIEYTYYPNTLVLPNVEAMRGKETAIYLRPEAASALELLFHEAKAAGYTLYAVSGYRSYALQKSIYQRKVNAVGEAQAAWTVAPPGASEHQLGLAMDINGETTASLGLSNAFGESPEGLWVRDNAWRYGFIVRYPKDKSDITGYAWEPWHLRYVGIEDSTCIYAMDVTLEEYCVLHASGARVSTSDTE